MITEPVLDALVVSNMAPDAAHPARGSFVRDQVSALEDLGGVAVELFEFEPGAGGLGAAAVALRRRFGRRRFDVVHAHFGLTAWPSLAARARTRAVTLHGTDLRHPRTRLVTAGALGRMDIVATVSSGLAELLPARVPAGRRAVLPCGVNLSRFAPLDRAAARRELGIDVRDGEPVLLFPADPGRAVKRFDRALEVAGGARLLTAGDVAPERMGLLVNAADAVLVPSEAEGFGLAVLEALACEVPVLATPVGIHAEALAGIDGTLCAEFDAGVWSEFLDGVLAAGGARVDGGRERASGYGAPAMAQRVLEAWRGALASGHPDGAGHG